MELKVVSEETAKLAKEKGFNQNPYVAAKNGSRAYYPEFTDGSGKVTKNDPLYNLEHVIAIAPSLPILKQWLRTEHKLHVQVTVEQIVGDTTVYQAEIIKEDKDEPKTGVLRSYKIAGLTDHDEILEQIIQKALITLK